MYKCTLASKFETKVYFSLKLQTLGLKYTLASNLGVKLYFILHYTLATTCTYIIKFYFSPFIAVLLFLSVCIFGGECWARDWLLYPNYNYVSWSYAFAVFSSLGHIIAAFFMFIDCQKAKERKEKNKVCNV